MTHTAKQKTESIPAKYPRAELEQMVRRWLDANQRAEQTGDWQTTLGAHYTDDAEYSWDLGPNERFVARGVTEIRQWALGAQMEGFDGWRYPYDNVLIDEAQGQVVGFWHQVSPFRRPDGSAYEVAGLGGSWFRYGGDYKWSWQRDFFDFGNVMATFSELAAAGHLNGTIKDKIRKVARGHALPGHVKLPHPITLAQRVKGGLALARIALIGR